MNSLFCCASNTNDCNSLHNNSNNESNQETKKKNILKLSNKYSIKMTRPKIKGKIEEEEEEDQRDLKEEQYYENYDNLIVNKGSMRVTTAIPDDVSFIDMAQDLLFSCHTINLCNTTMNFFQKEKHAHYDDTDSPTSTIIGNASFTPKKEKFTSILQLHTFLKTPSGIHTLICSGQLQQQIVSIISFNFSKGLLPPRTCQLQKSIFIDDYDMVSSCHSSSPTQLELTCHLLTRIVSVKLQDPSIINEGLCRQLITLFDSENDYERNQLKIVTYNIYKKYKNLRTVIKNAISHEILTFCFETRRHNGVKELLSICEAIVCGLIVPLKEKHIVFLKRVLIPLHRMEDLKSYHDELFSCIVLFTVKDPNTTIPILRSLISKWPWRNYEKQLLLIKEFEALLDFVMDAQLTVLQVDLSDFIARLLSSDTQFEAILRTLVLWDNKRLTCSGFLGNRYARCLLPKIYRLLVQMSLSHWSTEVQEMAHIVLSFYEDVSPDIYHMYQVGYRRSEEEYNNVNNRMEQRWQELETKTTTC